MSDGKPKPLSSLLDTLRSILGRSRSGDPDEVPAEETGVVKEIGVHGFDPDGEPVIRRLADGTLWIHFEAMPPFFAEDDGTESEFEHFESVLGEAVGLNIRRDDREVFVVERPESDSETKIKDWLEAYRR